MSITEKRLVSVLVIVITANTSCTNAHVNGGEYEKMYNTHSTHITHVHTTPHITIHQIAYCAQTDSGTEE